MATKAGGSDAYTLRVFSRQSRFVLPILCVLVMVLAVGEVVTGRAGPIALLFVPAAIGVLWTFGRERTTVTAEGIEVVEFLRPARQFSWEEIDGFGIGSTHLVLYLSGERHPVPLPGAQCRSLVASRRDVRLQEILATIISFNPEPRPAEAP